MKKSSDSIRFDTRVPLKEVMRRNPTTIQFEESVARAAMAMCRDEVMNKSIAEMQDGLDLRRALRRAKTP